MKYRIWYSTESLADYIIEYTALKNRDCIKKKMFESDANNPKQFHALPDHIKQILYLDAPDLIVELNADPVFSIEISTEAGTGHNVFQRFARLAASVENHVPAFYVYPEAKIIFRDGDAGKWDKINPLIFQALDSVMNIYQIPALFYYFPTDFRTHPNVADAPNLTAKGIHFDNNPTFAGCPDSQSADMKSMFEAINETIRLIEEKGLTEGRNALSGNLVLRNHRAWMQQEFGQKGGNLAMSPLSSTIKVKTAWLLKFLKKYESGSYQIGELLRSRPETIIYRIDAKFRGDPYPGALSAIDYLVCREGKSFEDRKHNLVLAWGNLTVDVENETLILSDNGKSTIANFVRDVKSSEAKNLLSKSYTDLKSHEIPRYFMQTRYGSTFSKVKHIRVFSYFADAILFPDGALWRDG